MNHSIFRLFKVLSVLLMITSILAPSTFAQSNASEWNRVSMGSGLRSVTWSGSSYIAVGDRGTIYQSTDGVSWTFRESPVKGQIISGVAWGNNTFVAITTKGEILTSPDGIEWSIKWEDQNSLFSSVNWVNNQFITAGAYRKSNEALGTSGYILTSPDGDTWTANEITTIESNFFEPINNITWGNGRYVAVGVAGSLYTSPDASSWTARDSKVDNYNHILAAAWGNDTFVAAGTGSNIRTSTDGGITWEAHNFNGNNQWFSEVLWANGQFMVFGNTYVLLSSDGVNWTSHLYGVKNGQYGGVVDAVWGNNEILAVGEHSIVFSSPDGQNWSEQRTASITSQTLNAVTSGDNGFVAVGEGGTIIRSVDGSTWTNQDSGVTTSLTGVAWGNGIYAAIGEGQVILTSSDGITWTPRTSATDSRLFSIAWGNGKFIIGGEGNILQTSSDGMAWTRVNPPTDTTFIPSISWTGDQFIASTVDKKFLISPDGVTWTSRDTGANEVITNVVKGDAGYLGLLSGMDLFGKVAVSADGTTWTISSLSTNSALRGVNYAGGQYTVVDSKGYIYGSTDGINWTFQNPRAATLNMSLSDITWGNNQLVAVGPQALIYTAPLEVVKQQVGSVTGTVVDASHAPINGATVSIGQINTTTNEQGAFTLTNVQTGIQSIKASASGYSDNTKSVTVSAGPNNVGMIELAKQGSTEGGNNPTPPGPSEPSTEPTGPSTGPSGPSEPSTVPSVPNVPSTPVDTNTDKGSKPTEGTPATSEESSELFQDPNDIFRSQVVKADNNVIAGVQARTAEILKAGSDAKTINYSDINQHWAISSIKKLTKLGVINGYPNGGFEPDDQITRAEFAAMITRGFVDMAGRSVTLKPEDLSKYRDINGHWSSDNLKKLVSVGVMTGYGDGTIRPEQTISRQEMAIMITRVLNASILNRDTSHVQFADLKGSYAQDAIKKAAVLGIFEGKDAHTFDPLGGATRAESIETIIKTYQLSPAIKEALNRFE